MASIRLIAQYPNVGNSGHIFFVPMGQKENYLGVGEKINTQMLSIRHGKIGSSDNNNDGLLDSSLFQGNDFLAVSIPAKQVLKDKSSDRVSHVWIALEGFDVASNESLITKLHTELGLLIPKVEAFVLSLGHLDPNAARYIEVQEMAEWAQNPTFLSVNKSKALANLESLPKGLSANITILFGFIGISVGLIMIYFVVCAILPFLNQIHRPNEPVIQSGVTSFMEEINRVCKDTRDDMIEPAAQFFGISKQELINSVLKEKWAQPGGNKKGFIKTEILIKFLDKIKSEHIEIIVPISDVDIENRVKSRQIARDEADRAKRFIDEANKILNSLIHLKRASDNQVVRYLIRDRQWGVREDFIIDFADNPQFAILADNNRNQAKFDTLSKIFSNCSGLSSAKPGEFKNSFEDLIKFSSCICIGSKDWYSFDEINKKIVGHIKDIGNR